MKAALKRINELISHAQPDNYSSVSYNKYFRDLTSVSNVVMDAQSRMNQRDWKIIHKIHELPESDIKNELLALLKE